MAQGQAVVLDNPRDPMGIMLAGQQQKAAQLYRQQQLGLQKQKHDQAELNKVLAHKYDDPGERFRAWGQEIINKANQDVMGVYQSNPNADSMQMRSGIVQIQGNAQKQLNYAKEINNIFNEKIQSIGQMKDIVDQEEAKRILNTTINKDSPLDVDRNILENIEQVPGIYDLNALVGESVSGIKDQYRKVTTGQIQSSPVGLFMEITDNKMRFKDLDKTMDFILRGDDITEEGVQQKINGGIISDRLRYGIAQEEIAANGGNPEDVSAVMARFKEIQYDPKYAPKVRSKLKTVLEQFQQEERDVNVQNMGKLKTESMDEGLKKNRLMLRDKHLSALQNPFEKGSDKPTKEAQAAIGRLLGGDFGGGKVTEAKFERGNMAISPEWMQKIKEGLHAVLSDPASVSTAEKQKQLRQIIKESKNHLVNKTGNKIKLTVKTGTIVGQPETLGPLPIDLSDPSAESILNALMNKNAGESNIPLDDVHFFRNQGKDSGGFLDDDEEPADDDGGFLDD